MGKRFIRTQKNSDIFLRETRVENLFINEYLPSAPGDYVRVYIFALMAAQNLEEIDNSKFAKLLGMTETEVDNAWNYWARRGVVRLINTEDGSDYGIEFISLIDRIYSNSSIEAKSYEAEKEEVVSSNESYDDEISDEFEEEESAAEKMLRLINEGVKSIYDEYEKQTGRLLSPQEMEKISDAIHVYNINPEVMS